MKMNKTLLRLVSVFFIVLVLAGCGIATYFYITVAYTPLGGSSVSVSGQFTFTDSNNNLDLISAGDGPSLLLTYLVTTEQNPPSSIKTEFSTQYKRNGNGSVVTQANVLTVTSGSNTYRLYQFSDSLQTLFRAPTYIAHATNPKNPNFEFSIVKQSDNTLAMSFPTGSYTRNDSGILTRFTGEPFETTPGTIVANPDGFPDYVVPSTGGTLYLHIYAAIHVSSNNKFWTDLYYVGYIQLNNI